LGEERITPRCGGDTAAPWEKPARVVLDGRGWTCRTEVFQTEKRGKIAKGEMFRGTTGGHDYQHGMMKRRGKTGVGPEIEDLPAGGAATPDARGKDQSATEDQKPAGSLSGKYDAPTSGHGLPTVRGGQERNAREDMNEVKGRSGGH